MTSYHNSLSPLFECGVSDLLLARYEGLRGRGLVDGVLVLGFGLEAPHSFCCALRVEAIGGGVGEVRFPS